MEVSGQIKNEHNTSNSFGGYVVLAYKNGNCPIS
jgi:hypothetical protein